MEKDTHAAKQLSPRGGLGIDEVFAWTESTLYHERMSQWQGHGSIADAIVLVGRQSGYLELMEGGRYFAALFPLPLFGFRSLEAI